MTTLTNVANAFLIDPSDTQIYIGSIALVVKAPTMYQNHYN